MTFVPPVKTPYAVVASPEIKTRAEFAELCNRRGLLGRAVEIGVDKAAFAVRFLQAWRGNKYVGVDPWAPLDDCPEITRDRQVDYDIAIAALAQFNWRIEVLRCTSEEAAAKHKVPLSFCYLDANKNQTRRDIALWWPHIAPGGILAGHDIGDEYPDVMRAVREFAASKSLTVYLTTEDTPRSWYTYKPPVPPVLNRLDILSEWVAFWEDISLGACVLSLIIPRLAPRGDLWARLRDTLGKQRHKSGHPASAVEILTDAGNEPVAVKRQRMLSKARGRYVAFVDDDDMLAEDYLRSILSAIMAHPGVDVVSFEGHRTEDGKMRQRMHWSMAIEQNARTSDTRYIMANHICAMRTELCRQVRFWRPTVYASDQLYWRSLHVARLLETEVHLPHDLYHYDFRWDVTATQGTERYADAKALNPHVLCRCKELPGTILYQLGNGKYMDATGDVVSLCDSKVVQIGSFNIW